MHLVQVQNVHTAVAAVVKAVCLPNVEDEWQQRGWLLAVCHCRCVGCTHVGSVS